MQTRKLKAVFFDRDGVLNVDRGYVGTIEQFEWMPEAREAIATLNRREVKVFVVTNQSGVARGFYGESDVESLHNWMNEDLARFGAHIDDFRFCPHHPVAPLLAYRKDCQCRKPAPGMVIDLLSEWRLLPDEAFLIGDSARDLEAASRAGVGSAFYTEGSLEEFVCAVISRT